MKRHLELGLEAEALEICKGLVLGCYRLSERAGGDVLEWAPDFPVEAAGHTLEVWHTGGDDPKNRQRCERKRSSLQADFLGLIPKWVPMIELATVVFFTAVIFLGAAFAAGRPRAAVATLATFLAGFAAVAFLAGFAAVAFAFVATGFFTFGILVLHMIS